MVWLAPKDKSGLQPRLPFLLMREPAGAEKLHFCSAEKVSQQLGGRIRGALLWSRGWREKQKPKWFSLKRLNMQVPSFKALVPTYRGKSSRVMKQ